MSEDIIKQDRQAVRAYGFQLLEENKALRDALRNILSAWDENDFSGIEEILCRVENDGLL